MFSFRVSVISRAGLKRRGLATIAPNAARIPVIDFSKFRAARSAEEKKQTANEIVGAFKDSGFIYVSNHGIPAETVQMAFQKVCLFPG